MRVLQLTVHFSPNVGGVETHLNDLVFGLAENKIETFVLTYQPLVVKTEWKMYEKHPYLTIFRLPWFPGFFYKLVHSPLIEFLYLVPGLFFVLPFVLLFFRPKIIHAHGLVAGFIGVFWGKMFGKRVIISTHSLYHFPQSGLYTSFVRWMFNQADFNFCLSNQSVDELLKLGVEKKKVGRFTYWVDLEQFKPGDKKSEKKKLGLEKQFVVFFVGRLVEIKGVKELLSVVSRLDSNITIMMAGAGPLEEDVIRVEKKYPKNLRFLGNVSNDKLVYYYNLADVVIIPSTHDEGFGRVILEALACGTPVIGSNRGAIPEAMDDTVGQFIHVSEKNILKIIHYFYEHKTELVKKAKKARLFAELRYSLENVNLFIDSYKS